MAKSDSFFIRASCDIGNNDATEWNQTAVDLGAYVDALGKSVLRIHNIAISFTDENGASPDLLADKDAAAQFQLSTQSQSSLPGMLPAESTRIIWTEPIAASSRHVTERPRAARLL